MATTSSIIVLLNFFSSRQKSATIDYHEFGDYLKKYSEHHVEEQPELVPYLGDPYPALNLELEKLIEAKQVLIIEPKLNKKYIYVIPYYIQVVADRYKDVIKNPSLPFPLESEMPKSAPKDILTRIDALEYVYERLKKFNETSGDVDKNDKAERLLYNLVIPHDVPPLLVPSTVPIYMVLDASFYKLRGMLYKEEFHDYFLKKVSISNPGKEIAAKTFFKSFVKSNDDARAILGKSEDYFYFWSQLCYFIRQDYEKVKDKTAEDISILQSISLIEIAMSFYKDKAQESSQKQQAFETLDAMLKKPPYFFTFDAVTKFNDAKGQPLTNYYTFEELKDHLTRKTSDSEGNNLPELLMFKVENGTGYFIDKEKVLAVVVRLCSEARVSVREVIKNHWHQTLMDFDFLPEMKTDQQFEHRLEMEVKQHSPILYALLNTSFLPVVHYDSYANQETNLSNHIVLFSDGHLIPYSDILQMSRREMLSDAKIMLPFWYSIPLISWLIKMLMHKPKKSKKPVKTKTSAQIYREEEEKKRNEDKDLAVRTNSDKVSRKVAFHEAARQAEDELVPADSTLDRELKGYKNQWNVLINKKSSENLTEDVNSLVRDYMRKVLRTMSAQSFTVDRIRSLAKALVDTPTLQKIRDHEALNMYIQLYIVKLVKNIPT